MRQQISKLAAEINLFSRDNQKLTRADIAGTYFLLIVTTIILIYCTIGYISDEIVLVELCASNYTQVTQMACAQGKIISRGVPWVGSMYAFTYFFYAAVNCVVLIVNYVCACLCYCAQHKNPNKRVQEVIQDEGVVVSPRRTLTRSV